MHAEFEMKMQVIRSKVRATRLFVNIPLPLGRRIGYSGRRARALATLSPPRGIHPS